MTSLFLAVALGLTACGQPSEGEPLPTCGDGNLDAGEGCDDGDNRSGDGCSAECEEEEEDLCGDGSLDASEECDDGNSQGGDGCSANCNEEGASEAEQIDEVVRSLERLPAVEEPESPGVVQPAVLEGDYSCTQTTGVRQSLTFDNLPALVASTPRYPGEILRGDSIYNAQFVPVSLPRQPMTFSASIFNFNGGSVSATMENPSLSEFQDKLNPLLAQAVENSTVPAVVVKELEEVSSLQQLNLAVGFDVSTLAGAGQLDVTAGFDFSDQTQRSRYLVKLVQKFYDVTVDPPSRPSAVFEESVTAEEISASFSDGNPPLYISSISFGRIVYFSFESEASSQELRSALEVAFNGVTDVNANVSLSAKQILETSRMNAVVIGGDPGQAVAALSNFNSLVNFINSVESGTFDPLNNPAAPIAYQISHLADNAPAAVAFASGEFDVLDCDRVNQKIRVELTSVEAVNVDDEDGSDNRLELGHVIQANGEDLLRGTVVGDLLLLDQDQPFEVDGGAISQLVLNVIPQNNEKITLLADYFDSDFEESGNPSDDIPLVKFDAFFQEGWRGERQVTSILGQNQIVTTFTLTPIP